MNKRYDNTVINYYELENNHKLRKQIEYINKNIPFYERNQKRQLCDFPIITKANIRDDYEQFISREYAEDITELLDILHGKCDRVGNSYNEFYKYKNFIFEETSGTSGIPFRVVKTKNERINIGCSMWKMRKRVDSIITPQMFLGLNHIKIGEIDWRPYDYDRDHLLDLYDYIAQGKFRWIHISPAPLLNHINVIGDDINCFDLKHLKYIECAGNFISEEQKELIESYFDVCVVNQYGSIETWPIAQSTDYYDLLKVMEDSVFIELVDENLNVIDECNKIGNVVITSLNLKVMPLIRYRNGDIAQYIEVDGNRYLKLCEGRDINIIGGLKEKIWGNIFFHKIVQAALRLSGMPEDLKYIQIQQHSDTRFVIEINNYCNAFELLENIRKISQRERPEKWVFEYKYLNKNELEKRKIEKNYLFIRKYNV